MEHILCVCVFALYFFTEHLLHIHSVGWKKQMSKFWCYWPLHKFLDIRCSSEEDGIGRGV